MLKLSIVEKSFSEGFERPITELRIIWMLNNTNFKNGGKVFELLS
jgi:hypothetical protein